MIVYVAYKVLQHLSPSESLPCPTILGLFMEMMWLMLHGTRCRPGNGHRDRRRPSPECELTRLRVASVHARPYTCHLIAPRLSPSSHPRSPRTWAPPPLSTRPGLCLVRALFHLRLPGFSIAQAISARRLRLEKPADRLAPIARGPSQVGQRPGLLPSLEFPLLCIRIRCSAFVSRSLFSFLFSS